MATWRSFFWVKETWGGRVGGGTLRGRGANVRRDVDGGGRHGLDAEGSEVGQERSDVSGVRKR